MRGWLKLAVLLVAAVVAAQILVQKADRTLPPGGPTPPLALPDLGGRTVDLAALRGRVVVVNFWATWCPPCQEELPGLAAAWRGWRGRCFELLGVVEESPREDVAAAARRIPYPILVDARGEAAAAWRVPGYPRTYVVDAAGAVRQAFDGPVDRGSLAAAVEPLLPASCPAP